MDAFDRIVLTHEGHRATLTRHGANVLTYEPVNDHPVLWLSPDAIYADGQAIRGGIPICAPWFGAHPSQKDAPAHGTIRAQAWDLIEQSDHSATLAITSLGWSYRYRVTLSDQLNLSLTAINLANQPRDFEVALHTYLAVSEIQDICVHGLENKTYLDKMDNAQRVTQTGPIRFSQETDRVYLNTPDTVVVDDTGYRRKLVIEKRGSKSTIIWNPWQDKAQRMNDFPDQAWPQMVCVESANAADNALIIDPDQACHISVCIRSETNR